MACLEGFEPPTYWFVASHSIQLSYKHLSEMSLKKDIHNVIYFITFLAKSQDAYLKSSKCTKYRLINITKIKITAKIRLCLDKNIFFCYNYICFETLAQSVEHTPFKRRVEGSNPSCLTIFQMPVFRWNAEIQAFVFYLFCSFNCACDDLTAFCHTKFQQNHTKNHTNPRWYHTCFLLCARK